MPVDVDSQLGPYQLLQLLGSGGTGRVYKARDTRLNRDVAIKILHREASADPIQRKRLEIEAQAVSSLNHPNILTLYDIGSADDSDYLVTEFIHGKSLREYLKSGPLPFLQLLDIGLQMAEGLSAAHNAGIVHRDLKPENIMITGEARVKILDFGLAKPILTDADTRTVQEGTTAPGLLLGTTAYMSPEQARRGEVSIFSDQFSLGLMLHEMATGKPVFARETALETLSAVLTESAPELTVGPVAFRWLVMRCLHKEPDHRYSQTLQIATELRGLRERAMIDVPPTPEPEAIVAESPVEPRRELRFPASLLLYSLLLLAAASVGYVLAGVFGKHEANPGYTVAHQVASQGYDPALSGDGRVMAWIAPVNGVQQVFLDGKQLTEAANDCSKPRLTHNGGRVYYLSGAALMVQSITGGRATKLIEGVETYAISPDERSLVFARRNDQGLSLWSAASPFTYVQSLPVTDKITAIAFAHTPTGEPVAWMTVNGQSRLAVLNGTQLTALKRAPSVKPREFAVDKDKSAISFATDEVHSHLVRYSVGDGNTVSLTGGTGAEWNPSFASDSNRVLVNAGGASQEQLSIRTDLLLPKAVPEAYVMSGGREVWINDNGAPRRAFSSGIFGSNDALLSDPALSPDGKRVAVAVRQNGVGKIWLISLANGNTAKLTPSEDDERVPAWSPDGVHVAYVADSGDSIDVRVAEPDAPGSSQSLLKKAVREVSWSPDGTHLLALTATGADVVKVETGAARSVPDLLIASWLADNRLLGIRRMGSQLLTLVYDPKSDQSTPAVAAAQLSADARESLERGSALRLSSQQGTLRVTIATRAHEVWLLERER